jgi:hypothetical protein
MTRHSPFRYFKMNPEIIQLAVMMYVRFPLSLRYVEDLLHKLSIYINLETVRFWWNRFGSMSAEIRRSSFFRPQPLQQGATPFFTQQFQTQSMRRTYRVASALFRVSSRIPRRTETGSNWSENTQMALQPDGKTMCASSVRMSGSVSQKQFSGVQADDPDMSGVMIRYGLQQFT